MPAKRIEDLLPRWLEWLRDIKNHVIEMMGDRCIFREVCKVVQENPNTHDPNDFVEWFTRHYAHSTVLAVRRQNDQRNDVVGLARLLRCMRNNAVAITRQWYVGQYPDDMQRDGTAHKFFDRWSGAGKDHVDAAIMKQHVEELNRACKPVKSFVDKRIAHRSETADSSLPLFTWEALDLAIDLIHEKACACESLLEQAMATMQPVWQYDWKRVFRIPWLGEGR